MALSLKQLLTPVTESEALTTALTILQELGFQATSWFSGSIQRTLVQLYARLNADMTESVANVTRSIHPLLAEDEYADLLGTYAYELPRIAATPTQGVMVLTSSPAAPPHTWLDGEIIIADAESAPANTYTIDVGDTLNTGATLAVDVTAQVPGSAANIAPNTTLYLWTPLAGVTVTNPAVSGSSTWISAMGQDRESNARYGQRMTNRFNTLAYGNTEGAYRAWVLEALPEVTRVTVRETTPVGTVKIRAATASGGIDAGQITTITDYLNGSDGVGRRPLGDTLDVDSATTLTVPSINITVAVQSSKSADAIDRVLEALVNYFGSLPIGGTVLPGGGTGYVLVSQMYQVIMALDGMINVTGLPAADIALADDEIFSPSISINVVPV